MVNMSYVFFISCEPLYFYYVCYWETVLKRTWSKSLCHTFTIFSGYVFNSVIDGSYDSLVLNFWPMYYQYSEQFYHENVLNFIKFLFSKDWDNCMIQALFLLMSYIIFIYVHIFNNLPIFMVMSFDQSCWSQITVVLFRICICVQQVYGHGFFFFLLFSYKVFILE